MISALLTTLFLLQPDKRLHFTYSAFISGGTDAEFSIAKVPPKKRLETALGTCLVIGAAKEGLDELEFRTSWPEKHPGQGADPADFAADSLGCLVGVVLPETVTLIVSPKNAVISIRF